MQSCATYLRLLQRLMKQLPQNKSVSQGMDDVSDSEDDMDDDEVWLFCFFGFFFGGYVNNFFAD